ncbi:MAG: HD domain-containing phosphohydrolase [Acidobacteriota bacterium]
MKSAEPRAPEHPPAVRRIKLQHILFLLLLVPSLIPLVLSSFYLVRSNRDALQVKEKELLTLSAQGFAQLLSDDLEQRAIELRQVGHGLVAAPGYGSLAQRLNSRWASDYLMRFAQARADQLAFLIIGSDGKPWGSSVSAFGPEVNELMEQAAEEARQAEETLYRFVLVEQESELRPAVALTVPIDPPRGDSLILQALVPVILRSSTASQAGLNIEEIFLIDAGGELLWSAGSQPGIQSALLESDLIRDFAALPVNVTRELELEVDGNVQSILTQVVPVRETGWGVVAHKKTLEAFQQVRQLVLRILMFSALAALLALGLGLAAARGFSLPIQRLAEATHEIAAGHFDRRVSTEGLSFEVAELAADFNRMSDTVQSYIARLQHAAEVNRQLFISSIRAFAAAIDAKDPYTRGHSERVASYSRAIARYLGLPKDVQEKVWISAVLHDVGKIGVEDRVLKKHGVLTPEEFDQMKLHPVIGADIVEPISALREHLPGIRWHHEAWNGSGYPDGLKGEQIPLMARIIGVADTFDAITTNRPYQTASSPEFALKTIKKLTGTRFDARIVSAFLLAWDAGQIKMETSQTQPAPPRVTAQAATH